MRKLFTVNDWDANLFSYQQPLVSAVPYGFWSLQQIQGVFHSDKLCLEFDPDTWELKYNNQVVARCTFAEVETLLEEIADYAAVSVPELKQSIQFHGVQSEFLAHLPENKRKFVVAPYDESLETTESEALLNIFSKMEYVVFDLIKMLVVEIAQLGVDHTDAFEQIADLLQGYMDADQSVLHDWADYYKDMTGNDLSAWLFTYPKNRGNNDNNVYDW